MIEVELSAIKLDALKEMQSGIIDKKLGRAAWFLIVMKDVQQGTEIPERFTLVVADNVAQKHLVERRQYAIDPSHIYTRNHIDIIEVFDEVKRRLELVKPATWDDFYAQMSEHFLYEE